MREQTEDRTIKPLYLKDSEIQYSDNGKKKPDYELMDWV